MGIFSCLSTQHIKMVSSAAIQKAAEALVAKKQAKEKRKTQFKRAENYVKEYRQRRRIRSALTVWPAELATTTCPSNLSWLSLFASVVLTKSHQSQRRSCSFFV